MIHLDIVELDPLHDLRIVCHVGQGYLEVYAGKVKFFGLIDEDKEVIDEDNIDDVFGGDPNLLLFSTVSALLKEDAASIFILIFSCMSRFLLYAS